MALSITAHQSIKKWDGKFTSVLRQSLSEVGLTNEDIVSSVSETQGATGRSWATQTMELKNLNETQAASLKASLKEAGARIEETSEGDKKIILVKRGTHLYQRIIYPVR